MTRLYAEIAIACSFLMRLSKAASIACLGNNVAICSAAFDALGPDNGVQSSACIADECVATCKPWYDAVNGGESCVPKPPKGWARGLEQQIPCPNNDQGICRDAFAPGYFSSGVASTECVDNMCVVTCRPLWESVNSGQYCKRGNTINICKDYETAEVLASNTPECNCWAATSGTAPDITCGCPAGQVFKTTSDFASVNKTLEDMVERGICFDSATDAPIPAVTNAV